mmetsp:Transcript_5393/g.9723  ORF Transcript_5393/g.9723 Transcript_5393/m.9723 type:complete len:203 (-) Transcript_5393:1018-1626(-)
MRRRGRRILLPHLVQGSPPVFPVSITFADLQSGVEPAHEIARGKRPKLHPVGTLQVPERRLGLIFVPALIVLIVVLLLPCASILLPMGMSLMTMLLVLIRDKGDVSLSPSFHAHLEFLSSLSSYGATSSSLVRVHARAAVTGLVILPIGHVPVGVLTRPRAVVLLLFVVLGGRGGGGGDSLRVLWRVIPIRYRIIILLVVLG